MLAVVARWTDTGRTDGRMDAKVVLYSVQCCTLHWTDKNIHYNVFCAELYALYMHYTVAIIN